MSIIENPKKSQTPKAYKEYKQDHGDAAQQRIPRAFAYGQHPGRVGAAKKEAEIHKAALADVDYTTLDAAQLDAIADQLLDLPPKEPMSPTERAKEALEDQEAWRGEVSVGDLLDRYKLLRQIKTDLLDEIHEKKRHFENVEAMELIERIEAALALIEEDAADIANEQSHFPTEVEYGVKSRGEVARKMAQRATLDHMPDDDPGDSDFGSHIRIRNRL